MAPDRPAGDLGPIDQRGEPGRGVDAVLAGADRQDLGRVRAVPTDVEGQAVEPRRMQELGGRQGPVTGRIPAVDEHDAGARGATASGDEPGRQLDAGGVHGRLLERQTEIRRAEPGRATEREAGPDAVDVGEPERGRQRGEGQPGHDAGTTNGRHGSRGRHPARPVKRRPLD